MSEQDQHEAAVEAIFLRDDAHISWADAETECGAALRTWYAATESRRVSAYAVYLAALEREEAAARDIERLTAVIRASAPPITTCVKERS
ncbi:MAG: hypothetical protein ABI323_07410 [Solirubrobacteraceae bacterium]